MSNGEHISKSKADRRISIAKQQFKEDFLDKHGYFFCERYKGNQYQNAGIAVSHIISVDECQKTGRAELAWDARNMEMLCNKAHLEYESNKHQFREAWFIAKQEGIEFDDFEIDYKLERIPFEVVGGITTYEQLKKAINGKEEDISD